MDSLVADVDDEAVSATVLVVDVADGSELWERWPDVMSSLLPELFDLFHTLLGTEQGRIISRVGDGAVAVFDDADAATRAAIAIQREVQTRPAGPAGQLHVAIGLHTGPRQHDGRDIFGATVHLAARVQRLAHGGQILATSDVVTNLTPSVVAGIEMAPVGAIHRAAARDSVEVHEVWAPGLRLSFPRLGGPALGRPDVPLEASSLIGRDRLVDEVVAAVRDHRLVTLCGTGGVGKSRVAVRVASLTRRPFDDGVFFVDLAVVRGDHAVADLVATTLRIIPSLGESTGGAVVRALRASRALLVLDSCEHVLGGVTDVVHSLLAECPWLHVLLTSRQAMGLPSEHLIEVPPLPADDADGPSFGRLSPAVALFVERARAVDHTFTVTLETVSILARLCRRLGGVPLAIELAASRVVVESLEELAARSTAELLAYLARGYASRDRLGSVAGSVAWSYDLLNQREQRVLVRMGAFAGTFTRDSAATLMGGDHRDVQVALDHLVRGALVARDAEDPARYRLLETVRMFAASQLSPEETYELRRAHADVMVEHAERWGPLIRTGDELDAARRLRRDFDDYRAAMEWLLHERDVESASRMLVAIFQFCHFQLLPEANDWASRLSGELNPSSALFPDVCGAAALAAWFRGDNERAIELGRRALSIESRTENATMWSCLALVDSLVSSGRLTEAGEHFHQLVAASRASPLAFWQINGKGYEAISLLLFGKVELARQRADQGLTMARDLGNPDCLHWSLHCLGRVVAREDPDLAAAVFEEAMDAARLADSRWSLSLDLIEWITLKRQAGDTLAAAVGLLELFDILMRAGNRSQLSHAMGEAAQVLAAEGERELAALLALTRPGLPTMAWMAADLGDEQVFLDELNRVVAPVRARLVVRARSTPEHDIVLQCRDALDRVVRMSTVASGRDQQALWRDVIVVYTDLVASTALNVAVGDRRFLELLREHNRIIRRRLAVFGGVEFTHTGDGVGASFSASEAGLRFAVGLQAEIDDANRFHPEQVLQVRIGLARGDVVEDEGNLFGQTVVRAVRICAAAVAGQVLIEEQLADAVEASIFACRPIGRVPLKGFGTSVPLYETSWTAGTTERVFGATSSRAAPASS